MTSQTISGAAVYCRVSSDEQRERQTINTQREFAERYCDLNQTPVHDYYLDDAVSGTVPLEQRPEGARLMADAAAKAFDTVLVYKLDRLGRDARATLNAVGDLEALGVQVRSLTESFDTSTPAGRRTLGAIPQALIDLILGEVRVGGVGTLLGESEVADGLGDHGHSHDLISLEIALIRNSSTVADSPLQASTILRTRA